MINLDCPKEYERYENEVYKVVQNFIEYLCSFKVKEGVEAIYILRSDETGQVVYRSYKQKK